MLVLSIQKVILYGKEAQICEMDGKLKRVAIIGNGGGGKSTLARRLAEKQKISVTHVDQDLVNNFQEYQ